jgi:hypothetical protein
MMFGGVPHVVSAIPTLTVKLPEPSVRKDRRQVDADAIHHLDRLLGVGHWAGSIQIPDRLTVAANHLAGLDVSSGHLFADACHIGAARNVLASNGCLGRLPSDY